MADDTKRTGPQPQVAVVVVFLGVLAGAYHAFLGGSDGRPPAAASPTNPPIPAAPAQGSGGWVRPVDAPLWGGFRTASNPDHHGVDIGAARGQTIRAAADGTVVRSKCDTKPASYGCDRDGTPDIRGCGWYVDLHHAGDIYTRYCHLLHQPLVAVGQTVTTGQPLGVAGSSGRSSAPHLHFEVHLGDQSAATAVDPVAFMAAHDAPLGNT